jgi:hypothetical protein
MRWKSSFSSVSTGSDAVDASVSTGGDALDALDADMERANFVFWSLTVNGCASSKKLDTAKRTREALPLAVDGWLRTRAIRSCTLSVLPTVDRSAGKGKSTATREASCVAGGAATEGAPAGPSSPDFWRVTGDDVMLVNTEVSPAPM